MNKIIRKNLILAIRQWYSIIHLKAPMPDPLFSKIGAL